MALGANTAEILIFSFRVSFVEIHSTSGKAQIEEIVTEQAQKDMTSGIFFWLLIAYRYN
jgi:hypothetical protein